MVKTYSVDQGEGSSGVKLECVCVVGLNLLRLEDVAWEGDIDGKGSLLVTSELGVLGGWLRFLRSDWLGFLLWLFLLGSLLGGGLG